MYIKIKSRFFLETSQLQNQACLPPNVAIAGYCMIHLFTVHLISNYTRCSRYLEACNIYDIRAENLLILQPKIHLIGGCLRKSYLITLIFISRLVFLAQNNLQMQMFFFLPSQVRFPQEGNGRFKYSPNPPGRVGILKAISAVSLGLVPRGPSDIPFLRSFSLSPLASPLLSNAGRKDFCFYISFQEDVFGQGWACHKIIYSLPGWVRVRQRLLLRHVLCVCGFLILDQQSGRSEALRVVKKIEQSWLQDSLKRYQLKKKKKNGTVIRRHKQQIV